MAHEVFTEPSECFVEEGLVVMDGPNGLSATFTPEAAVETSDRMLEAAMLALGREAIRKQKLEPRNNLP
jgi:hypothetical protein